MDVVEYWLIIDELYADNSVFTWMNWISMVCYCYIGVFLSFDENIGVLGHDFGWGNHEEKL